MKIENFAVLVSDTEIDAVPVTRENVTRACGSRTQRVWTRRRRCHFGSEHSSRNTTQKLRRGSQACTRNKIRTRA